MSSFKRDMVVGIAAAAAGALLVFLIAEYWPKTPESPILVKDGSMVLESEGADTLASRFDVANDVLIHKKSGKLWKITGIMPPPAPGVPPVENPVICPGKTECVLVVTYTDTSTITVRSGTNGNGLLVTLP